MRTITSTILTAVILFTTATATSAQTDAISIKVDEGQMTITPLNDNAVRIRVTSPGTTPPTLEELIYTENVPQPTYKVSNRKGTIIVKQAGMSTRFDPQTQTLQFLDHKGHAVLTEATGGRHLSHPADNPAGMCNASQEFISPAGEHLYGTGQFQDGYLDISELTRRLTQVNTQISIPFVLSSMGYGLQWNNYGLTNFNPTEQTVTLNPTDQVGNVIEVDATSTTGNVRERRVSDTFKGTLSITRPGTYSFLLDVGQAMARKLYLAIDGTPVIDLNNTWLPPTGSAKVELTAGNHQIEVHGVRGDHPTLSIRQVKGINQWQSPVATAIDYTVYVGTADNVIASYRQLTGPVPPINPSMLGYVHCRERYNTQDEIIATAHRFRSSGIPLDVIVQDWQYWGKYGWNAMQFDEDRYPDPAALTRTLHSMDIKFMLSVWSKVDRNSTLGAEIARRQYYIGSTDWVDFFKPEAAAYHWQNFRDKLLKPYDIDAWWFDATEPENDDLHGRQIGNDRLPGDVYRNVYPLKVIHTMYHGLLQDDSDRTPTILTRSAFSGMQRYGAIVWSGDVGNDLDCLRRQIIAGLGYVATGLPWWTYDAGGFFRPSNQYTDTVYQQRMIRWIQASVWLPVMRVHGYMSRTEPWNYLPDTERRFIACINERKALEDYLTQCAARVSNEGYTLMRPLVFDFPDDAEALRQETQYMFGPTYLVCPITQEDVNQWRVYLPRNKRGWTHHYTRRHYDGGQYITVDVDMEHIPVFERE